MNWHFWLFSALISANDNNTKVIYYRRNRTSITPDLVWSNGFFFYLAYLSIEFDCFYFSFFRFVFVLFVFLFARANIQRKRDTVQGNWYVWIICRFLYCKKLQHQYCVKLFLNSIELTMISQSHKTILNFITCSLVAVVGGR